MFWGVSFLYKYMLVLLFFECKLVLVFMQGGSGGGYLIIIGRCRTCYPVGLMGFDIWQSFWSEGKTNDACARWDACYTSWGITPVTRWTRGVHNMQNEAKSRDSSRPKSRRLTAYAL